MPVQSQTLFLYNLNSDDGNNSLEDFAKGHGPVSSAYLIREDMKKRNRTAPVIGRVMVTHEVYVT